MRAGSSPSASDEVEFLAPNVFRTTFFLPSDIPTGEYRVSVYLFRDQAFLAGQTQMLSIAKGGYSEWIARAALDYPFSYGLVCVALALFTGWFAGVIFRRPSNYAVILGRPSDFLRGETRGPSRSGLIRAERRPRDRKKPAVANDEGAEHPGGEEPLERAVEHVQSAAQNAERRHDHPRAVGRKGAATDASAPASHLGRRMQVAGNFAASFAYLRLMAERQAVNAILSNDLATNIGGQLWIVIAADENPLAPALQR